MTSSPFYLKDRKRRVWSMTVLWMAMDEGQGGRISNRAITTQNAKDRWARLTRHHHADANLNPSVLS
jgi:hypothetical protein